MLNIFVDKSGAETKKLHQIVGKIVGKIKNQSPGPCLPRTGWFSHYPTVETVSWDSLQYTQIVIVWGKRNKTG